jgi:hypothetical protein
MNQMAIQSPASVLMVRPAAFGFNHQTAASNAFQAELKDVQAQALREFDAMVATLQANDIYVLVVQDSITPPKPDAIFPNNWISFHADGTVVLYPMLAENRQWERKNGVLELIKTKFQVNRVLDFTAHEKHGRYLEGTGSMVIDYANNISYANRSARTHETVLQEVCRALQIKPMMFDALDTNRQPIYHTNVVMGLGAHFCVICLDAIPEFDQDKLLASFEMTNHKVVAISYTQMQAFAGNMMEVQSKQGNPVVLLSQRAFDSLLPGQANAIAQHAELLPLNISAIETVGGGSVRCMVAGVFNPRL